MYGATNLATVLGALGGPTTDRASAWSYGRALAKAGLPVVLLQPGTKKPADWRSPQAKKNDDTPAGVHLATTDTRKLKSYVDRAYKVLPEGTAMNWGVRLRGSGYVVADADTPAEVESLRAFLAQDYPDTPVPDRTVSTPGTVDGNHSDGGHWWFRLPDDLAEAMDAAELPSDLKITGPGCDTSFSLMAGDRYVLTPPSVRDAGPYSLVAPDVPLPAHLETVLRDAVATAQVRQASREERAELEASGDVPASSGSRDEQITQWAAATPWADILTGDRLTADQRWTATGEVDGCTCPVWTAPGSHASRKSAVTHEPGCTKGCYDPNGNAPMHIWTDNPGPELETAVATYGTKTLSKLRVVAALYHGGNESAAMDAAGIQTQGTPVEVPESVLATRAAMQDAGETLETFQGMDDPAVWTNPLWTGTSREAGDGLDHGDVTWLARLRDAAWSVGVDPFAVLLEVLARTAAATPPSVVLRDPAKGSLNLLVVHMAPPGGGKSLTMDLGADLVSTEGLPEPIERTGWSGQGMGKVFTWRGKAKDRPDDWQPPAVIFREDESDGLFGNMAQAGSTHMATFNKLFNGQAMGAENSTAESWHVPAHSYRGVVTLAGQDDIMAPMYSGRAAATGLAARWLVTDPRLSAEAGAVYGRQVEDGTVPESPDVSPVVHLTAKGFPSATLNNGADGPAVVGFRTSPEVLRILRRDRLKRNVQGATVDAMEAHAGFVQRKLATLLAIASGAGEVGMYFWDLAGFILDNSRRVITAWRSGQAEKQDQAKAREREAKAAELDREAEDTVAKGVASAMKFLEAHPGETVAWSKVLRVRGRMTPDLAEQVRLEVSDRPGVAMASGVGPNAGHTVTYTPRG